MNVKNGKSNPLDWKTKKITRVCRSIKTAEAISAEENCERGSMIGVMLKELLTGKKQKQQLESAEENEKNIARVETYIDNESTFCNINSDKNPEEQSLIYDVRRMQQMIRSGEISKVHIVDTKDQMFA